MAETVGANKEHPLAGVVLCFTSILPEQRSEIATVASQMGATHKFDLTSDVTHLLIGEVNTPKYKFVARERADVTVLKPDWVEAVRQSWMQGGDTDIRALEAAYRFPVFGGLSICITGFEDMSVRNYIQDTVTAHGAEFRKDLVKGTSHLIARSTEGDKYKFAMQWGIKIVSMKWLTDSLERGMVLEEALYDLQLPSEQHGVGAWHRALPAPKPKAAPGADNENPSNNPRPRKLRRIASTKLGDQNEGIWGDIIGIGFEAGDFGRSKGSQQSETRALRKATSGLQEVKSFASETTMAEVQESRPQPPPEPVASKDEGFLHGCYFYIHGFSSKQTNVLRHHLSFNGAQLVASLGEFTRSDIPKTGHGLYTIVPFKMTKAQVPSTDDLAFECEVVTDMWLERCLDAKTLVPPESHVANTPIPSFPVEGFSGLKVCSTGFFRIDLLHLSKLVNLIGATYNEYLTPKASVLVCNDASPVNQDKLRHTQEWGVPAVSADWLWASIRHEKKQPFEPYLIQKQPTQSGKSRETRAGSHPEQNRPSLTTNRTSQPKSRADGTGHSSRATDTKANEHHPQHEPTSQAKPDEHTRVPTPVKESPIKKNPISASPTTSSPLKRKISDVSTGPTAQSVIDLAVSGLMKQARTHSASEPGDGPDRPRSRARKPLLGRAPSSRTNSGGLSSLDQHPQTKAFSFSRASSIDTLNDDGCGSAIFDSNHPADSGGILSRANSTAARLEYLDMEGRTASTSMVMSEYEHEYAGGEDENEPPAMTQLDYEDPDAVAMREQFLHQAGKAVAKKKNSNQAAGLADQQLVSEFRELENAGWGGGRRTRHGQKAVGEGF
ncbi:subunit of DNA polymerase II [Aspergillus japonicus CBS 114.51]|uniref:Subunit of DNA polymerase II n=1 Tax=Aspergillus japonicus CBS 114.51 TaxID=1448312 RepID=A0A8T8WMI5_ASPJA|nr:subunit of DNA polymerase II [Aspergillus japonicus CBS 114.51]RAH76986.1 subunit of DNA polymerase II [Aspergillus japonicus CBS 114.51]